MCNLPACIFAKQGSVMPLLSVSFLAEMRANPCLSMTFIGISQLRHINNQSTTFISKYVNRSNKGLTNQDTTLDTFPDFPVLFWSILFDFWCFNATFNNISAIMATSFSGGGSRRESPSMGKQLDAAASRVHPFL